MALSSSYMVRVGVAASVCVLFLLQLHSTVAFTCYSCSTTTDGSSCCSQLSNVSTCEGGGCSTVYYPDGDLTRECDDNVRHGCTDVGDGVTECGCHANLCNTDYCSNSTATTLLQFHSNSAAGPAIAAAFLSLLSTMIIVY